MKNISEVRERIIAAAEKHFSILGFEKTTLDDITGEDGKSKTSIYYHFKNKHEIFKSVIEKEFEDIRKRLEKIVSDRRQERIENLRAYLRIRLSAMQEQGAYRHFASSRFAFGDNPVSRTVSEARKSFDKWEEAYLGDSARRGLENGDLPDKISPEVFASTVGNILKSLEIQYFSAKDKTEIINTYEGLIELL
ncbi:MAG: TetR/AcrR family transcriptional regulator [Bacteroidales bacterium]|nr:TetR/AcrR family transcriptional regulator [Candidatus Cacconaster merdequi]